MLQHMEWIREARFGGRLKETRKNLVRWSGRYISSLRESCLLLHKVPIKAVHNHGRSTC